jgi:O-acetyl-ADP-ribose deacetylase (regulator of RNase III)
MPVHDPLPAHSFGSITVRLVFDNLAERKADALVNAANNRLVMKGGLAATLVARGGIEIQQEAITHAPVPPGGVVRTGAGTLMARYVYHAVVINSQVSKRVSVRDLIAALRGVLACALTDGVRSLAMPLFGVGAGGLAVRRSLEAILETIEDVSTAYNWNLEVEIVVGDVERFVEAAGVFREYGDRAWREAEDAKFEAEFLKLLLRKQ